MGKVAKKRQRAALQLRLNRRSTRLRPPDSPPPPPDSPPPPPPDSPPQPHAATCSMPQVAIAPAQVRTRREIRMALMVKDEIPEDDDEPYIIKRSVLRRLMEMSRCPTCYQPLIATPAKVNCLSCELVIKCPQCNETKESIP